MAKRRADRLVVAQGLADTETRARALILAGRIWHARQRVETAGQLLPVEAILDLQVPAQPYASRGGVKLAAALGRYEVSASGKVCLDVGASTGGFTDVLLQRGALLVLALDVGKGQLDWRLTQEPRVIRLEGINARYLQRELLPHVPNLITMDVSFISLTKILPAVTAAVAPEGTTDAVELIALVKPQFEVPRRFVQPGGIVLDEAAQRAAVEGVERALTELGWRIHLAGSMESPIRGAEGNREFFVCAQWQRPSY